jgi:putative tryptophan/tyrosine transport system substrate-binding protein
MRRRDFTKFLVGSTFSWAVTARAQQTDQNKRVGILMNLSEQDPEGQTRLSAFMQGLQNKGWIQGRNVSVDTCWGGGKAERYRTCAAELIALAPNVILAGSGAAMPALMEATRSISIVFVQTVDPVGSGYVASMAKPDSNATGFTQFEYSMGGKWLELLKQIAPGVRRVAVLRDAGIGEGTAQFAAIQLAAPPFGVELTPISVRDPGEIERGINSFAARPDGGLLVTASAYTATNRDLIIRLAARQRLPAVYPFRYFVTSGGLISYGPEPIDPYRRAADYVDRILKGEKPGDLPVQSATKFQLIANLKTAKALDITMPAEVLARADEVIE